MRHEKLIPLSLLSCHRFDMEQSIGITRLRTGANQVPKDENLADKLGTTGSEHRVG